MQELALNELKKSGYTEDRVSKRAFERLYRPVSIVGVLLCLGPYPFTRFVWSPFADPFAQFFMIFFCFVLGFAICMDAAIRANESIPVSHQSGARMQRFLRSDAPQDVTEYLDVDETSKTYFARVVGRDGAGPG